MGKLRYAFEYVLDHLGKHHPRGEALSYGYDYEIKDKRDREGYKVCTVILTQKKWGFLPSRVLNSLKGEIMIP